MSEWINVKDKLPDSPSWVLVFADGAMNCMFWYKGRWQDPTMAQLHNIIVSDITHWMTLPEPPPIDTVAES